MSEHLAESPFSWRVPEPGLLLGQRVQAGTKIVGLGLHRRDDIAFGDQGHIALEIRCRTQKLLVSSAYIT